MSVEWVKNPTLLRLDDGRVLKMSRVLTRREARRMSRTRQVVVSVFPDLEDVTGDAERIQAMLDDYDERSQLFVWTAHLFSGEGAPAVVFDWAH